ncbi:MAG: PQQ-dependent sugar dehydrogenase [Burkholderiales bacterium]
MKPPSPIVALAAISAFCGSAQAFLMPPPPAAPAGLPATVIASGLVQPVDIVAARDGSARLFIVEKPGRIRVLRDGALVDTPFLDIAPLVLSGDERGLLSVAFHPRFAQNREFFVDYTRDPDGATVVARYRASAGAPDRAEPGSGEVLLVIAQPYANHNGGTVRFGPDGYLYIGTGDGGSGNDPGNRAQDPHSLLGKMLRIDVDGVSPYAIPADNPYSDAVGGRPEVWASGLRNPWKFAFDGSLLLIGDVGQDQREEIDAIDAAHGAGANFGWRVVEGSRCTGLSGGAACGSPGYVAPVVEYDHGVGCSVTGGEVYRGPGNTIGGLAAGTYVFGDFCTGSVWGLAHPADPDAADLVALGRAGFNISAFGRDADGEILVADFGGGRVLRLGAPSGGLSTVVEYHHAATDHYFVTAHSAEIAALDAGAHSGWARIGDAFRAWASPLEGRVPVCRYYLPPAVGGSHFYSADPAECTRTAVTFPAFVLETSGAFHVALPDASTGACPSPDSQEPVYRIWNRRADTNHRYTRDRAVRDAMIAAGGVAEGSGPDGVAFCAPR